MTKSEYITIHARIEAQHDMNLKALERIWELLRGDDEQLDISPRKQPGKKLSRSEAMKLAWARRRKKQEDSDTPPKKAFKQFLVTRPVELGNNGND